MSQGFGLHEDTGLCWRLSLICPHPAGHCVVPQGQVCHSQPGFGTQRQDLSRRSYICRPELDLVTQSWASPPRAEICHPEPRFATQSQDLPPRAGLCRVFRDFPRGAGRAGGWSMARCHSGKYFAGAVAAGPRPPAAVGAPGDPGDGASSRLPLPRSCSEAASIDTAPGHLRRGRATAPAAGDPAVPLLGDPHGSVGPGEVASMSPRCAPAPCLECAALVPSVVLRDEPPLLLGENFASRGIFYGENLQKLAKSQGRWAQPWVKTQPPTPTPGMPGAAGGGGRPPAHR